MHAKTFDVPYFAIGEDRRLKPLFILESFQEIACLHADGLGCGVEALLERSTTWVLRRYHVRILGTTRAPISFRTWYAPRRNITSTREFDARTADGELIADAWSSWVLLDIARGRPMKLDQGLPQAYFGGADEVSDQDYGHIRDEGTPTGEREFRVRRSDLDMNGHVNHTVYAAWALECEPPSSGPMTIDIEYLMPVKNGAVICTTEDLGGESRIHRISCAETGEAAAKVAVSFV